MNTLHLDMSVAAGAGRATVVVSGAVDASNADRLRLALINEGAKNVGLLVVALAGVTFMDSSALKAIADASMALKRSGCRLVLRDLPRQVLRILDVTEIGPLEVLE